jgi:hypothetical protein
VLTEAGQGVGSCLVEGAAIPVAGGGGLGERGPGESGEAGPESDGSFGGDQAPESGHPVVDGTKPDSAFGQGVESLPFGGVRCGGEHGPGEKLAESGATAAGSGGGGDPLVDGGGGDRVEGDHGVDGAADLPPAQVAGFGRGKNRGQRSYGGLGGEDAVPRGFDPDARHERDLVSGHDLGARFDPVGLIPDVGGFDGLHPKRSENPGLEHLGLGDQLVGQGGRVKQLPRRLPRDRPDPGEISGRRAQCDE